MALARSSVPSSRSVASSCDMPNMPLKATSMPRMLGKASAPNPKPLDSKVASRMK
ncbi:Uncharacterised protein [Mycobacteroides abscessus subsp. abscessus]|nr:Uncharacterised protein [Mycobacteroides abscessus subsp. abscessus]